MAWLVSTRSMEQTFYRLTEQFMALRTHVPPSRVMIVQGPTGSGRSTLFQAFYEYLAARQPGTPYWPPSLGRGRSAPPPGVLIPDEFAVPAGAVLPWMWWGLDGRDPSLETSAQRQWMRHTAAFVETIRRLEDAPDERRRFMIDALHLITDNLPFIGTAFGGVGDLEKLVELVRMAPSVFASQEKALRQALRTDAPRRFSAKDDAAGRLASDAVRVGKLARLVPLIAVVDDAQDVSQEVFDALETVIRTPGARVLVALAIDSERVAPDGPCSAFIDKMDTLGLAETATLGPFTEANLALLCSARMRTLGQTPYPSADALGEIVRAADGNPGRLIALMARRPVQEALLGRATMPPIQPDWLATPELIATWMALTDQARTALAKLACHGPRTMIEWVDSDVVDVARGTGWVAESGEVERPQIWFRSRALFIAASAGRADQLSDLEIRREVGVVLRELRVSATGSDWRDLPTPTLVALLEELADSNTEIPDRWRATLMRLHRVAGKEPNGRDLLDQLRADELGGELLLATAEALADAGFARRAVDLYEAELDRIGEKFGTNAPQTVPPMHNLAGAWAAYASTLSPDDAEEAWTKCFSLFERVIAAYERAAEAQKYFKPARLLPDTRSELARYLHSTGRYEGAYATLAPAIDEYDGAGVDGPTILTARGTLALYRGEMGDLNGAIADLRVLLEDKERTLGPMHPSTLNTRGNLASFEGDAGDWESAVKQMTLLLAYSRLAEGEDWEGTLATRGNLAFFRGKLGDRQAEIRELTALLPDLVSIMGASYHGVLAVRHNLATAQWEAGMRARAIVRLAAVLLDSEQMLGGEHPDTVTIRTELARYRAECDGE